MFSLQAKVAVVTGGGKGIGRGISAMFARAGADVVVVGRDSAALEDTVRELTAHGVKALSVAADVCSADEVDRVVQAVIATFGQIDCWVNNVGGGGPGDNVPVIDMDEVIWDNMLNINLRSAFLGCRAAARAMRDRGGSIINITSAAARMPIPGMSHYGAAKLGLENMTTAMAIESGHLGIRVNAVQPAVIDTSEKRGPRGDDWLGQQAARTPMGVNGAPDDIGAACVYLASDEARWVTGSVLIVDGGCRIPMGNEDYVRKHPQKCGAATA